MTQPKATTIFDEPGRGSDLGRDATMALRDALGYFDSDEQAALWLLIAAGREVLREKGTEFKAGVADTLRTLYGVDAVLDGSQEYLLSIARDIAAEIM